MTTRRIMGIAMVMVVKQPCIEVALAQRGLNGGKVHWKEAF